MNLDFKRIQDRTIGTAIGVFGANELEKVLNDMVAKKTIEANYKGYILLAVGAVLPEFVQMKGMEKMIENAADVLLAKGVTQVMVENNVLQIAGGEDFYNPYDHVAGDCGCNKASQYVGQAQREYLTDEKGNYYVLDANGEPVWVAYIAPTDQVQRVQQETEIGDISKVKESVM